MLYDQIDYQEFCCQDQSLSEYFQSIVQKAKAIVIKDPNT